MSTEPVDVTAPEPLPPLPPPSRSPQTPTVLIALLATLLLVSASLTATLVHNRDVTSADGVQIGDCVRPLKSGLISASGDQISQAPADVVDCAEPGAAYRVALAARGAYGACPDPAYRVQRVGVGTIEERTLCMTYNVHTDECFVESPLTEAGPYDCARGPRPGAIRVLRVVEGAADPMRCVGLSDKLLVVTVPEPATTFCYVTYASDDGVRVT